MGSGFAIKNAITKYGIENFKKEIIYSRIINQSTADSIEKFAIQKEKSIGKAEYNLIEGGHGYRPTLHKAKSDEWKQKMSTIMKGKTFSKEHRKALSKSKIGNKNAKGSFRSVEYREKQRISHLGYISSEETKKKQSEANKARMQIIRKAFYDYKLSNPNITWNDFQKLYKSSSL